MGARETALRVLMSCRNNHAWADAALKAQLGRDGLVGPEAALCSRLVYGVVQNQQLLDFYLSAYCSQKPDHLQPPLLEILRLGAYQILYLDRVPDSAAVNTSVELAKISGRGQASGLVNAVLRKIAQNKTALPLGLIHVRLRLSNLLTGQSELRSCRLSARPRRTETAEYDLASAHCGRIAIEAACCRIYDPFGLIGIRLKQTVLAQTTVQPKGFAQTIFISPDANCPDDSESYAPDRAGYDLSEVYQLREYRPGDSLRQMHWKLSGKLDRLVIREASLPVRRSVLLFWERTQKAVPEGTDAQADVVVTFCRSLLEAGVQFTIAWNDATEQRCVSQQIRSMDELIGLLPRLLSARENEGLSGAELFLRSSGEAVLSHILYITGRVPEQAYLLGQFGRLTVLSCGASGDGAICFDCEHYAEQLAELEI